tara:strand:- start:1420 stop:1590 length:171 start_codon:yes stop_codon:yes gene_type:complete
MTMILMIKLLIAPIKGGFFIEKSTDLNVLGKLLILKKQYYFVDLKTSCYSILHLIN